MFYYNYVNLCNKKCMSPSAAAEEMGFHRSDVTRWSKGVNPRQATLQKVADYFGVSVDELTADTEKAPTNEGERDGDERLKAAFFEGADPSLTKEEIDDLWQDAKEYMFFKIRQRKMKRD